jgi:hypothetical protein
MSVVTVRPKSEGCVSTASTSRASSHRRDASRRSVENSAPDIASKGDTLSIFYDPCSLYGSLRQEVS